MSLSSQTKSSQHGLRRQALAEALLLEILEGRIRAGEHMVLRELSQRFGVSATPLREALITLAGMGVVDLLPNRGAIIRRLAPEEVRDILQVRRALECEATRAACGRLDLVELEEIAQQLRRLTADPKLSGHGDIEMARTLDSRLHDLIASSCGNLLLAKELNRFKILFRAFRDVSWQREEARRDYRRLHEEAVEHLAIVDALLADDGKGAARAMARHIRGAAKYWSRVAPVPNSVAADL